MPNPSLHPVGARRGCADAAARTPGRGPVRWLCLLALLAACSGEPVPPPVPGPSPFPLRLLPDASESSVEPLLEDDLTDLSPWRVLSIQDATLRPAAGHPALRREGDVLHITRPFTALVRLVELPARTGFAVMARLAPEQTSPRPGQPCEAFMVPTVQEVRGGEGAAALLASGMVRTPKGRSLPLERLLLRRIEAWTESGDSRWTTPRDAEGLARARFKLPGRPRPEVRALVLAAMQTPLAVGGLRLVPKPSLLSRAGSAGTSDLLDAGAGPHVERVLAGGEWRPALRVPAGSEGLLEASLPATPQWLGLGVCIDPAVCGAGGSPRSSWSVELLRDGAEPLLLGEGRVEHDEDDPLLFEDLRLGWPAGAPGDGPVTLRFAARGDAAVVFGQPTLRSRAADRRPNLLLVSLDTVRADHLGYQGYERPTSPHLDAFAAGAVAFLDTHSVGPYTLPTHATLFTGMLPLRHGVTDGWADRMDAHRLPYLPRLLAQAGYATAGFTGGGYLSADFGFAEGFDRFRTVDPVIHHDSPRSQRRTRGPKPPHLEAIERGAAIENVADWVADHRDEAWFAFVHTYAPHEYDAPEEDFELFDTEPGCTWGTDAGELLGRLKPTVWPEHPPGPADVEHLRNIYDAALHFTDRRLGRLLERLEQDGLLDNTVVVITSDHGEEFYEHRGMRHSISLYEEMLRVPLLIRAPGAAAGRRVRDPVSLADLSPTLLELLGLPAVPGGDGRSLAALVMGQRRPGMTPALLLGHVDTSHSSRISLRDGRFKLIHGDASDRVRFPAAAEWELYDLSQDPLEQYDLMAQLPEEARRLRRRLEAVQTLLEASAVGGGELQLSPEQFEELAELGYVGGDAGMPARVDGER